MFRTPAWFIAAIIALSGIVSTGVTTSHAQQAIELTLDSAVDIAMGGSYRIKQLELNIERNRYLLKARQASLKSRVYMNLRAPQVEADSDFKWNSEANRDVIVRENTSRWQMDLSVQQPVILFGYPTNGYLSLNNRVYQYNQRNGGIETDYYNRYYLRFQQPFFQPNVLKNDIEEAKLDLERRELEYVRDRVNLINSVSDDFYDLFDFMYRDTIYNRQIENLNAVVGIAAEKAAADTTKNYEYIQAQIELTNARESLLQNNSSIRRESNGIKQRLRMDPEDSVHVEPTVKIVPLIVDKDQAVEYGYSLSPSLRIQSIDYRNNEINLDNSKGWDAFRVNLEMTYGLEKEDKTPRGMWEQYDNSYSVSLSAYVPIWDWGRRKDRIEAQRISLKMTELRMEENRNNIRSNILNAAENLIEYQQRAINLEKSLGMVQQLSDISVQQYRDDLISLQDMLRIASRQRDTELNFLDAYLGYRRSLLWLMVQTYYDYENGISLIDKYRPRQEVSGGAVMVSPKIAQW